MEKDLFLPIKHFFEMQGYVCDGEVKEIDLYMEKDGESCAVELKLSLDFKSVQQAAIRQKVTDYVYIGILRPKNMRSSVFRDKLYLLKRLGIGLISVSPAGIVEIINEPVESELSAFRRRAGAKRKAIEKEFGKRRAKNNIGGVHGTKLVTSYRESALLVLDALSELGGEATVKAVRELSGEKSAAGILRANYYGWFEPVSRGIYKVRDEGYEALEEFEEAMYLLKTGKRTEGSSL